MGSLAAQADAAREIGARCCDAAVDRLWRRATAHAELIFAVRVPVCGRTGVTGVHLAGVAHTERVSHADTAVARPSGAAVARPSGAAVTRPAWATVFGECKVHAATV